MDIPKEEIRKHSIILKHIVSFILLSWNENRILFLSLRYITAIYPFSPFKELEVHVRSILAFKKQKKIEVKIRLAFKMYNI